MDLQRTAFAGLRVSVGIIQPHCTSSTSGFTATVGAYQPTLRGGVDAFVAHLNISGTALLYRTYLGGSGDEKGFGLALDSSGNAYVSGPTSSSNLTTTLGAFQSVYGGGAQDAFVAKLNPAGSSLLYASYLGGSGNDFARDIAVDAVGNAYLNGSTASADFPITDGAYQTEPGGGTDLFITKFGLTQLEFITQPTTTAAGATITPPVVVRVKRVEDGGTTYTAYTGPITLTLVTGTGTAGAVLGGTATATALNGVASFANLSVNLVGQGYRLAARGNLLDEVESAPFNITGSGNVLEVVSGGGQQAVVSTAFARPLVARVKNGTTGNPVAGVSVSFQAPAGSGGLAGGTFAGGGGTSYSGTTNASGLVTTSVVTANAVAGSYSVVASAAGVANPVYFSLSNTPTTTINTAGLTLVLDPPISGPNPLSSTVTLTVTLKRHAVTPISNQAVQITLTGVHTNTYNLTTNSQGMASFSYTGTIVGVDQAQASATVGDSGLLTSNTVEIHWVNPGPVVTLTPTFSRFYTTTTASTNLGFLATPQQSAVFSQTFPTLVFNPPPQLIAGTPAAVSDSNGPFTNVSLDANGNYLGHTETQGNGLKAGVRLSDFDLDLRKFDAVFVGSFVVRQAGTFKFSIYSDDGIILGIGKGATAVPETGCNINANAPSDGLTPFEKLPIMAAPNVPSNQPQGYCIKVNFPAPGLYPYELDYNDAPLNETMPMSRILVVSLAATDGITQPLSGVSRLILSPATLPATNAGPNVTQTVTLTVTDAVGNPHRQRPVTLLVTGLNRQQLNATTDNEGLATFTYTGQYVGQDNLQALAWINGLLGLSNIVTKTWTLPPTPPPSPPHEPPVITQCENATPLYGLLSSPAHLSQVFGTVAVRVKAGSGFGSDVAAHYWPVNNPAALQALPLVGNGTSGEVIATLDTTTIVNGSYIIRVCGKGGNDQKYAGLVLVSVGGENKPGRVAFSLTDFTVPVAGLPIVVGRSYDSLERNQLGDFGYGWSLSIGNPKLEVNSFTHDVTLTLLDGKRVTFYFQPQPINAGPFSGFGFTPTYQPEPGVYGSLSFTTGNLCPLVVPTNGLGFMCGVVIPSGYFNPIAYHYRDPYGRLYELAASGRLLSLTDLSGNKLTFSDTGITSSAGGRSVSFERWPATDQNCGGCIKKITDSAGKVYEYEYTNGDLTKVKLPGIATPILYSYYTSPTALKHFFKDAKDPRGKQAVLNTYYSDGRLESMKDAAGQTTNYTYTIATNSTTITTTNPPHPRTGVRGKEVELTNSYGKVLSETDPLGRTITYTYNTKNNVTSQRDAKGNLLEYTYDPTSGFRTSVKDPTGKFNYTEYNAYGGPTMMKSELGITQTVKYDDDFMPSEMNDKLGLMGKFSYNQQGSVLTQADGNNKVTGFSYDAYGNKTSQTDPLGRTTHLKYDALGRVISGTDALGYSTKSAYDALGRPTVVTDTLSQSVKYEYDANGNLLAEIDQLNRRTEYEYDELDRVSKVIYPDGTTQRALYDYMNNVISVTNQLSQTTLYEYDLAGQQISMTMALGSPDAATTRTEYDENGNKSRELDANNRETLYEYDENDNLLVMTSTTAAGPLVTRYSYDDAGRKIGELDANLRPTTFVYDERNRLARTIYTDTGGVQVSTVVTYHPAGYLDSRTDLGGKTTRYEYDEAGQLVAVINPNSEKTSYTYDERGSLKAIIDAKNRQTKFEYDELGRQVKKIWPNSTFEQYAYDEVGNRKSVRLADNRTNFFIYDNMNRLKGVNYFDSRVVSYTYNAVGLRSEVNDTNRGITRYRYDNQNRLRGIVQPGEKQSVAYTYDPAGNRLSMMAVLTPTAGAASTYTTGYSYDELNRLSTVTDAASGVTSYAYDKLGLRTAITMPNGIVTSYSYSPLYYPTGITHTKNGSMLAAYLYEHDQAGNRTGLSEYDGSTVNWRYDPAYRLISETRKITTTAPLTTLYNYDEVGNRQTMQVGTGPVINYSYNESDQLVTDGTSEYSYDLRGNLLQIKQLSSGAVTQRYTYDGADRQTQLVTGGNITHTYGYDADGRRVSYAYTGGSASGYVWDESSAYGDVVAEYTPSTGAPSANYTLGGSELLSQRRGGSSTSSYYLLDGHSGVRALANPAGSLTDRYRYDAFGNLTREQGTTTNPYLYTGQQFDVLTGLYSLRARYYNPGEGRFLSRDVWPVDFNNPVELNRYGYTANSPVDVADPSGRSAELTKLLKFVGAKTTLALRYLGKYALQELIEEIVAHMLDMVVGAIYDYVIQGYSGKDKPQLTLTYGVAEAGDQKFLVANDVPADKVKDYDGVNKLLKQVAKDGGMTYVGVKAGDDHSEVKFTKAVDASDLPNESRVLSSNSNLRGICSGCKRQPNTEPFKSNNGIKVTTTKKSILIWIAERFMGG